jgi:hypothetical protein
LRLMSIRDEIIEPGVYELGEDAVRAMIERTT